MGKRLTVEQIRTYFPVKSAFGEGCIAEGCQRPRRLWQGQPSGLLCNTHRDLIRKQTHPEGWYYRIVRQHARQRNIPFHITRKEWDEWCKRTGYCDRSAELYADRPTVDRIKGNLPYTIANIQMLKFRDNAVKGNEERWGGKGYRFVRGRKILMSTAQVIPADEIEGEPF